MDEKNGDNSIVLVTGPFFEKNVILNNILFKKHFEKYILRKKQVSLDFTLSDDHFCQKSGRSISIRSEIACELDRSQICFGELARFQESEPMIVLFTDTNRYTLPHTEICSKNMMDGTYFPVIIISGHYYCKYYFGGEMWDALFIRLIQDSV